MEHSLVDLPLFIIWMITIALLGNDVTSAQRNSNNDQGGGLQAKVAKLNVSALIVLGDSTVDVGMNNHLLTVVKSNFLPYGENFFGGKPTGRFCDGQIIPDYVASFLGFPFPLPYFDPNAKGENIVRGINFASSASGYNDNTSRFFNVISLTEQIGFYKIYKQELAEVVGPKPATEIISKALHVLSTGNNDFVNNYFFNIRLKRRLNIDQYISQLLQLANNYIEELYSLGARRLVIVGLPPLGCIPSERSILGLRKLDFKDCIERVNEIAKKFNQGLQNVISTIKSKHSDFLLLYLDSYGPILDMYQNPSKYGFEVVTRGCCSTGRIEVAILCNPIDAGLSCKDPSKYLFWDSFHPTQTAYKILADMFINTILNEVPE